MVAQGEARDPQCRAGSPAHSFKTLAGPTPWFSIIWLFGMAGIGIGAAGAVIGARLGSALSTELAGRTDLPPEAHSEFQWLFGTTAVLLVVVVASSAWLKFQLLRMHTQSDAEALGFRPRLSRPTALTILAVSSMLSAAVGAGLAHVSFGGRV